MEEKIGLIRIQRGNVGSKSDGLYAHLLLDSGEDYILYQSGHLAMDDTYFQTFDGLRVKVVGEVESEINYLRVENIQTI